MVNNKKIIIISSVLVILGLMGIVLLRQAPQSIVWEGYYSSVTFTFSPEPIEVSGRWTFETTESLLITLTVDIETTDYLDTETDYLTEIVIQISPDRSYQPDKQNYEVARVIPVPNQPTFILKGEFYNAYGIHDIKIGVASRDHGTLSWNYLTFVCRGPVYPMQDILAGNWVAIGAVEGSEDNGDGDNGDGDNGDDGLVGDASGFEWSFTLLLIPLIYKRRKKKKVNYNA